jgi:hypothetical protein
MNTRQCISKLPRTGAALRRRWRLSWRWRRTLLGFLIVGGYTAAAFGTDAGGFINREYEIKAGFLYHFSNYIDWPTTDFETPASPFVIGVYRDNPFGAALDKIASRKKVHGRPIEVRLIQSVEEAFHCQILFVPKSVPVSDQTAVVRATIDHPVLVVGEVDDFVARGGNVQFFVEGNKVRFAVGATSLKRDDLKVSSKLLALAQIVETEPK